MKLVNNLIQNTTPKNAQQSDPFWERAEVALDTALMLYLLYEAPPEEQNLETVLYMLENGGASEEDEAYRSPLDLLFEALEDEEPDHIAVREYHIFQQAAGKTARSILITAAVRLSAFIIPEIRSITSHDEMELSWMGERKQAVFAVIPDSDSTFNYLVGMLYTCAFQSLYYQADRVHQGPLPVPVRLMMDEFCNVALPSDFGKIQSTMRSRNIMSTIVLQNISGLKALFKDDWEGLLGNADTLLYLGGNEQSTHKYISEMLGKETLDVRHRSTTRGRNGSDSVSRQQLARELMTPDEVRSMDNRCALLFIRGEKPVMDEKYDLLRHPNLRRTADGGAAPYVHKAADYIRKYEGDPPTLKDLYDDLLRQKEPAAHEIALALELFTTGSLNIFAHQTNIDTDSRITCYDIQDLGENLKPIGLLVMLDSILNRVIRNRQRGRYTHVYIDEIYLFFASPGTNRSGINNYSSEFLYKCWKRFRKYYATLTGITQNVEECLLSDTARLMFANSEFLVLLNQAPTDRAELAKLLGASDAQMDYVSDAPAGHGLIKVGSCLVPFINELPRDTELYRLMTTKPGEQNA